MGQRELSALNDNEREVLRLLLAGYDAKAAARELDITTNVVNERLRQARRKLGVTSSKEAARILAVDEDLLPKKLVPKNIGIDEYPLHPAKAPLPHTEAAARKENVVRDGQAAFQPYHSPTISFLSVPFRKSGEHGNDLSKAERLRVIADLSAKFATALALICLAAILISTFLSRS